MQIQSKIPAFDDVSHLLAQTDSDATPSEIHGLLCGFICVGSRLNGKFWLDILLKQLTNTRYSTTAKQELILNMYDAIGRQLSGLSDKFSLLLPLESASLLEKAKALSEWCQGFSYSLSLTSNPSGEYVSEEVHDVLHSIAEVADLNLDDIEMDEKDAAAYHQVVSYVESSVTLIYSELADNSFGGNANQSPQSHQLH